MLRIEEVAWGSFAGRRAYPAHVLFRVSPPSEITPPLPGIEPRAACAAEQRPGHFAWGRGMSVQKEVPYVRMSEMRENILR